MTKILRLLCLFAFASAQLDFEDDAPEDLLDNSFTRDLQDAIFGSDIKTITIFSNFDNPADQFFFQNVLPWLVDNIGNYLRINYRFRSSARRSGPRACALRGLRTNTYMQAEYLRCESRGNPPATCVNRAPIDRRQYNRCLNRRVNDYVRQSQWDFETLSTDRTPMVLIAGRREVPGNDPVRLLREICRRYGRTRPSGCLRPVPLPQVVSRNTPAPTSIADVINTVNNFGTIPPFGPPNNVANNMRNFTDFAGTNIVAMPYSDLHPGYSSSSTLQASPVQMSLHFITILTLSYVINSSF